MREEKDELQYELNQAAKELHGESLQLQALYNKFNSSGLRTVEPELYDRMQYLPTYREVLGANLRMIGHSDVDVAEEEELGEKLAVDGFWETVDYLQYLIEIDSNPLDSIWIEPSKIAREDSRKLQMKIVSDPIYQDLVRRREIRQNSERRRELVEDLQWERERLLMYGGMIEELIDRIDLVNLDAARDLMVDYAEKGTESYLNAVGLMREVNQYRSDNWLVEAGNLTNLESVNPVLENREENPEAEDIETEPLSDAMEYIRKELEKVDQLLDLDPSPEEILDDSAVLEGTGI